MALTRVKTWVAGETLTANDLNNEFNNIVNNVVFEPFVATQTVDLNGQLFLLDADGDSYLDASTDDTIKVYIAGAEDFRLTANTVTVLSGSSVVVENGNLTITAGNAVVTAGNLTVTDGTTTLANPDARTTTVATPLTVAAETSGTPDVGIGTGILVTAESVDETPSNFGQLDFSASDVTAASEDTFFRVWLRVAGAALAESYRWASTSAFSAISTHANSANRTYTWPDASGTVVLQGIASQIGTTEVKTATGSATVTTTMASVTVTMNDYSFFPGIWTNSASDDEVWALRPVQNQPDPSNTVGRLLLYAVSAPTTSFDSAGCRWRYFTSTDEPTIWVIHDPVTGLILASWVADDPPRLTQETWVTDPTTGLLTQRRSVVASPDPPIAIPGSGLTATRIPVAMLQNQAFPQPILDAADAHIERHRLKPSNRFYRALQILTRDDAPSRWLHTECLYTGNELKPATKADIQAAQRTWRATARPLNGRP